MTNPNEVTDAKIREAGGIVHRDGNIFFTNAEQFLKAACTSATSEPAVNLCRVAQFKLDELQAQGYKINGYSIQKPGAGGLWQRGFITDGGMVCWWNDKDDQPAAITPAQAKQLATDGMVKQAANCLPQLTANELAGLINERDAQPAEPADYIHSCSFFCDLPGCIKTQRDLLRDHLCKKATP